jgi:hypothetical protein
MAQVSQTVPLNEQPLAIDLGGFEFEQRTFSYAERVYTSFDQPFSLGEISGREDYELIEAKRTCIPLIGCVTTPAVTADTRSGVRMIGSVSGEAGIGFSFAASSPALSVEAKLGLMTSAEVPSAIYAYSPFRPRMSSEFKGRPDVTLLMPSLDLDPFVRLGFDLDMDLEAALPGLGLHGGAIDLNIPQIDVWLPELVGLGNPFTPPSGPTWSTSEASSIRHRTAWMLRRRRGPRRSSAPSIGGSRPPTGRIWR